MRLVNLTRGKYAIVDDADFEWISSFRWQLLSSPSGHCYAAMWSNGKCILMHRLITGAESGAYVDHYSGDGLDNRRSNIRICTQSQNIAWAKMSAGASGFRGVYKRRSGKLEVRIKVNGVRRYVGSFRSPMEAAIAYNKAAMEAFGEFARVNEIDFTGIPHRMESDQC